MLSDDAARIALTKLAFGPDAETLARVRRDGLAAWLDAQARPDEATDAPGHAALARVRLRIRYPADPDHQQWPATDEARPLALLAAGPDRLWPLNDKQQPYADPERNRPRQEVAAATIARAVSSRWQLREVMVDFWHNHFNVNGAGERAVGVLLPPHDREAVRPQALGNFRALLEAVASSPAMLVYLNNRSSRAGAPNENFARELFELHTMGRDAYLAAEHLHWRDVPGARQGNPRGYVDEDVYEAARAFTGWSISDGAVIAGRDRLGMTGQFTYVAAWHDNYQKRVLAEEYDPYAPPQGDGRRVLDRLARHPATARHVCTRLAERLVGTPVPPALLDRAIKTWTAGIAAPDQIYRTVRAIALAPEFTPSFGRKVKRPLELAASFVRASGIELGVTEGLVGELDGSGQRLFGWGPPTGHPEDVDYWLSANAARRRVSLIVGLADNAWGAGKLPVAAMFGQPRLPAGDALRRVEAQLLPGVDLPDRTAAVLSPLGLDAGHQLDAEDPKARRLVASVGLYPEFQLR